MFANTSLDVNTMLAHNVASLIAVTVVMKLTFVIGTVM